MITMKKIFLLVIIAFTISMMTNAQSKKEKAVANAVEQLRKAMIDADKTVLEDLVMDDLSYGHSGGHIDDKKEFVEKIISGKSDFVTMDLSEQTINIKGKTAVVRHKLNASTNDSGKPGEVHLLVMLIWVKQGGHWKLWARQAVKA